MEKVSKEKKIELHRIVERHDVISFLDFIGENIPDSPILKMSMDDVSMYMHQIKATDQSYGSASQLSRNALRAASFGYSEEKVASARPCRECEFFRSAPERPDFIEEGENQKYACMHLGATPDDIECTSFKSLPKQGVAQ